MNAFWETVLSNAVLVMALALGLAALGRIWKNPAVLHVLWILALVKLFTPPLLTVEVPVPAHTVAESMEIMTTVEGEMAWSVVEALPEASRIGPTPIVEQEIAPRVSVSTSGWVAWIWLMGIGVVALTQAGRVFRFRRVLRDCQAPAGETQEMAVSVAKRLGLRRVPRIFMTPLRLSPMVWRLVGPVRVILPIELFERLDREAQEAIVAHELAHVRRKDHLVRLLELAATTLFWWHPVAWWAARSLRELEEQCCDAMALDIVDATPRDYATALVDTLEFLSKKSVVAVMGVTAVKRVVSLTRRIEMLKSHVKTPRLTFGRLLLLGLVAAVPLGLTFAAQPPAVPKAKGPSIMVSRRALQGPTQHTVIKLSNSPAVDVAQSINEFLRNEQVGLRKTFVVQADVVTNSLLIAASESLTETITKLVEKLDERSPTVRIEALLAEVNLAGDDQVSASTKLKKLRALSGTEATIEDLIETLKLLGVAKILSRPQIMTIDSQAAYVQIGERVPRVMSMKKDDTQASRVEMENVGLILAVTPRITPEGRVIMEVDAERSELGPVEDGIPIGVSPEGEVIRSPVIKTIMAQTTISVADGELAVFAGMATEVGSEKTQLLIALRPHIVKDDDK